MLQVIVVILAKFLFFIFFAIFPKKLFVMEYSFIKKISKWQKLTTKITDPSIFLPTSWNLCLKIDYLNFFS
jgi:hypothetical protein